MTQLETKSFLLTVSVKGDLSVESEEKIVSYLRKQTLMHHAVIEHGESNKRHLHACMIFKESRDKAKIQNNVWERFVKPFHGDSIGKFAVKVQVCPGNDWYNTYLKKESGVQELSSTWDPTEAQTYFPTPEVQEALQCKARQLTVAAPHVEKDVANWISSEFENTPEGALQFLHHCYYVSKTKIPNSDQRKTTQIAFMYYRYRNGITSLTERERWLLKQLEDGPSYDAPIVRPSFSSAPPSI